MAVGITAVYNNSYHSPGYDIAATGLEGFTDVLIERVDLVSGAPDTPVRGGDHVTPSGSSLATSDYEAPVSGSFLYRLTATSEFAIDDWARSVSGGLGTATTGQVWTTSGGSSSHYSVDGTYAVLSLTAVNSSRWGLMPLDFANISVEATVSTDVAPAGGAHFASLAARVADVDNCYLARLEIPTAGTIVLTVRKRVAGAETLIEQYDTGLSFTPLSRVAWKFEVVGTALRAKAWSVPGIEPVSWQIETTDTSISASGQVGFRTILSSANTNPLPVTAYIGDFRAEALDGSDASTAVALSSSFSPTQSDPGAVWVKSVGSPTLSRRVNVSDWSETSIPGRILGEYEVLGRKRKVVITDTYGGREGRITLSTYRLGGAWESDCSPQDVRLLLTLGGTLLFQSTGESTTGEEDMYFEVRGWSRKRVGPVGGDFAHLHDIEFVEVDRPATADESLTLRSWQSVLDQNGSWDDVITNHTSWLDVLQRDL